ncbi:MAG: hypothetical protein WD066_16865 [Planctomycetaceae bacterium]
MAVTLDAKARLSIEPNDHLNEQRSLAMLSVGVMRIADNLKARETEWDQRTGGKITFSSYGLDIDGTRGQLDVIGCFFHWFGVSICNYARLVGFIQGLATSAFTRRDLADPSKLNLVKSSVDAYEDSVAELADVRIWRNKIAAHFAITAPRKDDNVSTLDMSVMFPVSFDNGRYRVSQYVLSKTNASGTHTSAIPSWSVTEVFEALIPRYWPQITISQTPPVAHQAMDAGKP